jgi:hypothetical protein
MPGWFPEGMPEKKASKAASPPAEAPMPTTGKPVAGFSSVTGNSVSTLDISGESGLATGSTSADMDAFAVPFFLVVMVATLSMFFFAGHYEKLQLSFEYISMLVF